MQENGVGFELTFIDGVVFVTFLLVVVLVGMLKGRGENDSESYFLAGRGLSWWLIGMRIH